MFHHILVQLQLEVHGLSVELKDEAKYTLNAKRYIRTNFKLVYFIIFLYNFNLKFTFCQWNLMMKQNTRLTLKGTSEPTSSWYVSGMSICPSVRLSVCLSVHLS